MTNKALANKIRKIFEEMAYNNCEKHLVYDGYTEIRCSMISVAFHDDRYDYEVCFYNYGNSIGATSLKYGAMNSRSTQFKTDKHVITVMLAELMTRKDHFITMKREVETSELEETSETSEISETKETEEATIETIPHVDVDCSNLKKVPKNSIYGMFGESQDTEHDRIKYLMDTHSLSPRVTINDDCMKTVLNMEELLTQRFGNRIAYKCKMYNNGYYGCPADRQGNRCCGKKWCAETWERYKAIVNPEWHHVSLNTLANLDFDMLDEKRQLYLKLYRELKELIQDLHKCKSGRAYERRLAKMYIRNAELFDENKISHDYINYVTRKISMCNVECGLWTSRVEEATGLHKSRRYNMHTLRY